jgi:hypothetical protein
MRYLDFGAASDAERTAYEAFYNAVHVAGHFLHLPLKMSVPDRERWLLTEWTRLDAQYPAESAFAFSALLDVICTRAVLQTDLNWCRMLQWLLAAAKAAPNLVSVYGTGDERISLLMYAVCTAGRFPQRATNTRVLLMLLRAGARFSRELDTGRLARALSQAPPEVQELLLAYRPYFLGGIDPNRINAEGDSLLHAVARNAFWAHYGKPLPERLVRALRFCRALGADAVSTNARGQRARELIRLELPKYAEAMDAMQRLLKAWERRGGFRAVTLQRESGH